MAASPSSFLGSIPASLRDELLDEYNKLIRNFRENRWEPAELNGGKLSEIVYSILEGYASGAYPTKAEKPANFYDACKALEKLDPVKFPRAIRIQIPRLLVFLYEVRNNRGVGHVGGDVNPNFMDASCVVSNAKWVLAELVRIFHAVDTHAATAAVETITSRELQVVWDVNGKKRVLTPGVKAKDATLLLLYNCIGGAATEQQLFEWVEHSNKAVFRRDVLKPLHKGRLIELGTGSAITKISPTGINYVEEKLLKP